MIYGIKVGLSGFSQKDEEKFRTIFQRTRFRRRPYRICPMANDGELDILIVNGNEGFFEKGTDHCLARYPNNQVAVVTKRERPDFPGPQIIGPLTGKRSLKVLDTIKVERKASRRQSRARLLTVSGSPEVQQLDETFRFPVGRVAEKKDQQLPVFTVLVVDDSPLMQKMLALEFAETSMNTCVHTAENGEEALSCVAEWDYDFIFLDVMMPGIDGYETCSRIRKHPGMKKTPIIMLSAKTSPLDEVKGIMAGCTTYLTKPIQHEEFQRVVERIMRWLDQYRRKDSVANAVAAR